MPYEPSSAVSGEVQDVIISPCAVESVRLGDLSQMVVAAPREAQANLRSFHQKSVNPLLEALGGVTR